MTENLKIEVSMVDVEGGLVDTSLATKEELSTAVQSKADLIEGKVPVIQLPGFNEINGVSEAISGVETKIREEVETKLTNSNNGLESRIDEKLILKADLVNGRVPASQSPAFKDVEGAKGALDGLKEALTTKYDQKVVELSEGKADLVDGKIPTSQLPIDGIVTPLEFQLKSQELDTKFSNLEDSVEAEKNAFITQAGNLIAGKANAVDVYNKATVDNKLGGKVDVLKYEGEMTKKANQTYVDAGLTAVAAGHKAYTTLALAQAAQATLPANTIVEVTNDPTASNNGTYQWNGTTLTKSAHDPLTQAKTDAATKANAAETNAKTYTDNHIAPIASKTETIVEIAPQGKKWAVLDEFGRAALTVSDSGEVSAPKFKTGSADATHLNGVAIKYHRDRDRIIPNIPTEVDIQLSYGQSLSFGSGAIYNINKVATNDNYMLNAGLVYSSSTSSATTLVDAVTTSGLEPPSVHAANMVRNLIESEAFLNKTDYSYQIALCATGQGGVAIHNLIKGTEPYSRNIITAQKITDLASAQGKVVKSLGWYMTQGETDYSGGTSKELYKSRLDGLITDMNADIKAITGQTENLKCIGYQTRIFGEHALNPRIALAQLELSQERNDYFIACPMYHLQGNDPRENVHPDARGYAVLGAYYGLVYKRAVIDGEDWKPLHPVAAEVIGSTALVKFHVPVGKLVIDTEWLPEYLNYGFRVTKPDGTDYTITGVKVINPSVVKITTSETMISGSIVKYGHGAGGNLRDEQGKYLTTNPVGGVVPLHNWCVISQVEIN